MEAVLIRSVTGRCRRDRTPVSLHRPGINYKYTRISMYKPHSLSSLVIQGEGIKRVSLLNLFYQKKPSILKPSQETRRNHGLALLASLNLVSCILPVPVVVKYLK